MTYQLEINPNEDGGRAARLGRPDPIRRKLLQFGFALPLALESLSLRKSLLRAEEKTKNPPRRILFICNSLGFHAPYFFPKTSGDLATSEYLRGMRSLEKMTVFSNLFLSKTKLLSNIEHRLSQGVSEKIQIGILDLP